MKTIKVGTRGSALARTQTQQVIQSLSEIAPEIRFEMVLIETKGDLNQTTSLDKFGDKGIFVMEIEDQLLKGDIDIAVHSMKDMPSLITSGLAFAKPPKRQDPRDVLVSKTPISNLSDLPKGAKIGTGSKRRRIQLQKCRPDFDFHPLRGNIDTRIKKLYSENLDAIVLAAAGIKRMGLHLGDLNLYELPYEVMLPAPAQGALALQYRENDASIKDLLEAISHEASAICVDAERSFLKAIEGGCHAPMGAIAEVTGENTLSLKALFGNPNGQHVFTSTASGDFSEAKALGIQCADQIKAKLKKIGHVILLGAGPGDVDLITVKGLKAIESCDAIVYDRLASEKLLQLTPEDCEKFYVGKASGNHFYTQDETNQLLVTLASQGKKVVRLKGGDPYVFGRGGEEGQVLKDAGISFEVVPGISSSIAGLNYAGIPITHRDYASSFHVFTAHFKEDESDLDFKTISQLEGTLVFLMGIANMHRIAQNLMAFGKDPKTPVAMISKATTVQQKTFVSTLEHVLRDLPNDMALSPALFVVGHVVSLREDLNWFEKGPLFGTTTLVSRSTHQASKLEMAIESLGGQTLSLPLLDMVPCACDEALLDALETPTLNHLWFTSENSVHFFMNALKRLGKDTRALAPYALLAIGNGTAKALGDYHLCADYIPEVFTQEGIVDHMRLKLSKDDHVLLPQGNLARPYLAETLKGLCQLTAVTLYETKPTAYSKEAISKYKKALETRPLYLPFTSSSTATHFHQFVLENQIQLHPESKYFAIGPTTEKTLKELGYKVHHTASTHNIAGLVETLKKEKTHEAI